MRNACDAWYDQSLADLKPLWISDVVHAHQLIGINPISASYRRDSFALPDHMGLILPEAGGD
jgi:hypothetical protein